MKFEFPLLRTFTFGVILRTFLLTLSLVGTVLLFSRDEWSYGVCAAFLVLIFAYNLIRYAGALNRELGDFTESVQYRDFSRNFSEKRGPAILRQMHRTFNVVNHTFRRLSFEKEAQYQYLQNILELVDTGILSFDEEGEVAWMNESLKRMLQIPYLKSLEGLQRRDPALAE
ncbi:MAG: ATP-binding protein, partial [Bacteroidetes bacterium]